MTTPWWEMPYKGAPMIAVPGFPRPLYPPDASAKGKKPSVDGPDVEAYKRVCWRLGRWLGPPFGRDYANAFAHGRSGNVPETGIAGVQRQGNIDDSGWIGKPTFNLLRSVLIPASLPNAGQHAMDAYAQSLLVDAWEEFGGKEPAPPPTGTVREAALKKATGEVGTKENPANSNLTKYGAWYGMDGNPWCAMFTTWSYELAAEALCTSSPSLCKGESYAYVPYIVSDARAKRNGLSVTSSPIPGDLVCYDWAWDGTYDHVEIFEAWVDGDSFRCVGGNTSDSGGSQSNGGEVCRQTRSRSSQGTLFVRVAEP